MYSFLSLLCGALIAVMIAVNGNLTALYGVYPATVIIHIAGLILILAIVLIRRERPFQKRQPLRLYAAGVIGVATTVFNNLAFGRLSVSAILGLGLLAQSVTGIVIDHFGLMEMPVRRFQPNQLWGLLLMAAGIVVMVTEFSFMPVLVSLLGGVTVILSRVVNGALTERTSLCVSTLFNYITGLCTAILICLLLPRSAPAFSGFVLSPRVWIYTGGMIGVATVTISSLVVHRLPSLNVTVLMFLGQVFTGILVDALLTSAFLRENLIGGVLVAAGLCLLTFLSEKGKGGAKAPRTDAPQQAD